MPGSVLSIGRRDTHGCSTYEMAQASAVNDDKTTQDADADADATTRQANYNVPFSFLSPACGCRKGSEVRTGRSRR